MIRTLTAQEEDRHRTCRERKSLTAERVEHVNRIKTVLSAQCISDYEPLLRRSRERLEGLRIVRYLGIGRHRFDANSIGPNLRFSRSSPLRLSGMLCSTRRTKARQRREQC